VPDASHSKSLDEIWFEAQHVVRNRVRHSIREHVPGSVGGGGFHLLSHVIQAGPVSPSELAARLDIRSSTIANHLDRLEEAGWIVREAVSGTSTRVQVRATAPGEEAYRRYLELRRTVLEGFLEPLGDDERALFSRLLERALEHADRWPPRRRAGRARTVREAR